MSLTFAVGLMIGAAVIVFGQVTALGRRLIVALHRCLALLRRWFERRR